jgi:hypothetical protein
MSGLLPKGIDRTAAIEIRCPHHKTLLISAKIAAVRSADHSEGKRFRLPSKSCEKK